ncbi:MULTISPECIES: DUF1002 domain-containing protein [unclassified Bacillus (in: firmicutes)]|uniref:DUF1002 domain-containing protein n=1 Tax=unclassified Bacillus (in: firmicutes) TaxID=185979 RepID=UPI00080AE577|nr:MULTISPECIES: DUF1002 domain-containing protein [unclassified Bacillus (in: firmicutes)]OCA83625.1 hypothetical protein A8L44_12420 [Bacillus sp. FJAT-27986]
MKKQLLKLMSVLLAVSFLIPSVALADMQRGDMVVTLGENLTQEQKKLLLAEMDAPKDVEIVTVSNSEEHKYLDGKIASRLIGTKAISSSSITIAAKGSGITVKTKNINWVTEDMYKNALATAGIKDAEIYVTAPFEVSGTAALTGLIKAYEVTTDTKISEEQKQAANEEMVETAKLGDQIGTDEATSLVESIKEEIAVNPPQNDADLRSIIEKAAEQLGITLTEQQIQSLIDLFNKLQDLGIDWNKVGEQINAAKDKVTNYLQSEEGQSFLDKLKAFFVSLIDAIKSLFS